MSEDRHPTQAELIGGAIRTIEEIFLPELQTSWARASAVQLTGLLRYALSRQEGDLQAIQDVELLDCLRALPANPYTAALTHRPAGADLRRAASELLVHAQTHDDELAAMARERLRPLLAKHTAEDLVESGPLLQGFMTGFRGMRADAE